MSLLSKSAPAETTNMVAGTVKKWISGTGKNGPYSWGFVDVGDGKVDVFVHGPTHGVESLKEGQTVMVAFKDVTVKKTGKPGREATKVALA